MGQGIYQVDLRAKSFDRIRQTIADGKKVLQFSVKKEAQRKAEEIEQLLMNYGAKRLETFDLVLKVDPLALQDRLAPYGKTVEDAVNFYVAHLSEQAEREKSQTLGNLMDEWLAEKKRRVEQNTLRKATYDTLYYKANGANGYKAQWGTRPVATISTKEIEEWIESRVVRVPGMSAWNVTDASQTSKVHQLAYLSQFFIWCKRKYGVPRDNPCEPISVQRDELDPKYFTPEQAKFVMSLSTTKRFQSLVPFHAICLFAGVRTEECERLDWSNIDFADKAIVINKADAKTRKHRRVEMQSNLLQWLNWFREKNPQYPLIPSHGLDDRKRQFRKRLNGKWLKNGMRHSYASYILGAKRGDFGYLEQNMGNSRTMLQNHYINFPTKKTSEQFWGIVPPSP